MDPPIRRRKRKKGPCPEASAAKAKATSAEAAAEAPLPPPTVEEAAAKAPAPPPPTLGGGRRGSSAPGGVGGRAPDHGRSNCRTDSVDYPFGGSSDREERGGVLDDGDGNHASLSGWRATWRGRHHTSSAWWTTQDEASEARILVQMPRSG